MSDIVKKAYAREAETGFNYRTAMEEASRCLLCEDAPCSRDCPASTNPAKFIRSLRFKNIKGAAETIRENNPLGGCCAWVCPYDRLCEKACSRVGIDRPIKIGSLQRFLIEEEERGKMDFIKAKPLCGKKVACIGSGPASLSCARQLAAEGVSVEIYECKASAGGIFYKTISVFIPNECSPRFDIASKENTPWTGFKNMEMTSDKPNEVNFGYIKRLKKDFPEKVIVASIMGSNDDEWAVLAKEAQKAGSDMIECNFSCPQMTSSTMGSDVGQSPELVKHYCEVVSANTTLPVIAKMTPNIGNMEIPARAAIEGGAKGIAAINTVKSITNIDLDLNIGMPVVNGKSSVSGYSGAAVKPIALRFISDLKHDPLLKSIPLTGIGGIETWRDCVEFLLLGASNIQVTTAIMQYGYRIVEDMISGLSFYMEDYGIKKVEDIVGKALDSIVGADELDRTYKILVKVNEEKCTGCKRCYVSCFDGGHQAIIFDDERRRPEIDEEKCVGCHLCLNVCPVMNCIMPGKLVMKDSESKHDILLKESYL